MNLDYTVYFVKINFNIVIPLTSTTGLFLSMLPPKIK
jgi:hypothetical protein